MRRSSRSSANETKREETTELRRFRKCEDNPKLPLVQVQKIIHLKINKGGLQTVRVKARLGSAGPSVQVRVSVGWGELSSAGRPAVTAKCVPWGWGS